MTQPIFKMQSESVSMLDIGMAAKQAASRMAMASSEEKNQALATTASLLRQDKEQLLEANRLDLANAEAKKLDAPLVERLRLSAERIEQMAEGCEQIAALADPVGEIEAMRTRPSGIQVGKMRVPLGVVAIIYESRPNVTIDAAALCIKSGNATILRGGSEAITSNKAVAGCVRRGLESAGLPSDAVILVPAVDRQLVGELIRMDQYIDIVIPRGGKGLIERISRESSIPTIKHLDGVCHVYVDREADLAQAEAIVVNSKTHRYGVCNALETLLLHEDIAQHTMQEIAPKLVSRGVELRLCERTAKYASEVEYQPASEADWTSEYLAPILAVKTIDSLSEAIAHINRYGSAHTDAIVTREINRAQRFLREVDSASVMVNASTRFADGFEFGLGAEIGISTDKLHARGPVGLDGLTSQKYIVLGDGHTRA